ncbi:MAG TPA: hypothetical protein VH115_09345 [Solirubrobacteraceae bacterium]|nr:hypothetical protein [Solirubrobacteraceae bacterium]
MSGIALADGRPGVSRSLRPSAATDAGEVPPILVAGADLAQRAAVLDELAQTLPDGTRFQEAGAFWEVLARSPECRMVIFSGDLEEGAAEEFMLTLRQRHPELPTVSLKVQALQRD